MIEISISGIRELQRSLERVGRIKWEQKLNAHPKVKQIIQRRLDEGVSEEALEQDPAVVAVLQTVVDEIVAREFNR